MRPKLILALLLLGVLAACSTPQEYCILRATEELRKVERLIADVRRDLERGYTTRTETYTTRVWRVCSVTKDAQGEITARQYCWDTDLATREVAEPIDPAEEQRKLQGLERQKDRLARTAAPKIEACRIAHPE